MYIVPIVSKQISFVQYDDESAHMTVHYHTGRTLAFNGVLKDDYQMIISSANSYDSLMKLTDSKGETLVSNQRSL
jgi:hypothetical protein